MAAPLEFGVFPRGLAGAPGRVARGGATIPRPSRGRSRSCRATDRWERFVTRVVNDYGHRLAAVQVTGEANLSGVAGGVDGAFPRADEALVRGVLSAAEAKRAVSATAAIGFAAAVQAAADPAGFWSRVRDLGGTGFANALDYAGIDVYVDVFGPRVGVERVAEVVGWVLRTFREQTLPIAGIPASTPIRICENGWPSST